MPETTTEARPTVYLRFLRSGLTVGSQVWRKGAVLSVTGDDDNYAFLSLSESDQRARWKTDSAWYEMLTADQHAALAAAPSVAPEPAPRVATAVLPPPPEDGAVRGNEAAQPLAAEPGHVEPSAVTPPPVATDPGDALWPWYADANVDDTLAKVADMPEAQAQAFLAYEIAHKNRKGITGPMTGS